MPRRDDAAVRELGKIVTCVDVPDQARSGRGYGTTVDAIRSEHSASAHVHYLPRNKTKS